MLKVSGEKWVSRRRTQKGNRRIARRGTFWVQKRSVNNKPNLCCKETNKNTHGEALILSFIDIEKAYRYDSLLTEKIWVFMEKKDEPESSIKKINV